MGASRRYHARFGLRKVRAARKPKVFDLQVEDPPSRQPKVFDLQVEDPKVRAARKPKVFDLQVEDPKGSRCAQTPQTPQGVKLQH